MSDVKDPNLHAKFLVCVKRSMKKGSEVLDLKSSFKVRFISSLQLSHSRDFDVKVPNVKDVKVLDLKPRFQFEKGQCQNLKCQGFTCESSVAKAPKASNFKILAEQTPMWREGSQCNVFFLRKGFLMTRFTMRKPRGCQFAIEKNLRF